MRLARTAFYLSGALISAGLLLYLVLSLGFVASLGDFRVASSSLPAPTRLSEGGTVAVTPACPVTLLGTGGLFPRYAYATISSGTAERAVVGAYRLGDTVICPNPPGRSIQARIDALDLSSVQLAFQ